MAKFQALTLASVALLALARVASAADLLPPPPALEPPPPMSSGIDASGWYLRGDIGIGVTQSTSFSTSPSPLAAAPAGSTDNYYDGAISQASMFDFGVGYQLNSWFRADVTSELRGGSSFEGLEVVNYGGAAPNNQYADFYRGNMSSYIAMVNGYADIGTWYGVTPFVGAGVGFAYNKFSGVTDNGANVIGGVSSASGGLFAPASKADLAFALMAGLDFNVTRNLKLELGYRYLNYGSFKTGASSCLSGNGALGSFSNGACSGGGYSISTHKLASNDFRIGLRWMFDNGPSFEPEPAPIVRKY